MEITWIRAATRWQKDGADRHPETIRREEQFLRWLGQVDAVPVDEFGPELLYRLRDEYRAEGQSPRSVNYMVGLIRSVLLACVDWGWRLQPVPRVRKLREPPPRDFWLRTEQEEALVMALPDSINDMCAVALDTGLRKGNVSGLVWEWCDYPQFSRLDIPAAVMKARYPHSVPMTSRCTDVMARRWEVRNGPFVFHRNGRPINQPNGKRWQQALVDLGLEGLRWHDLRHTWASHHAQAGTDIQVLRQMGAWRTLHMVSRYAHLDLRPAERARSQMEQWREQQRA